MAVLGLEDIKLLSEYFATKQDLHDLREELVEKFVTKQEMSDLRTIVENIAGDIKEMKEENFFHRPEHEGIREELDEVKSLPTVAHELKLSKKKR
jgi:regulator of replication initiation timing